MLRCLRIKEELYLLFITIYFIYPVLAVSVAYMSFFFQENAFLPFLFTFISIITGFSIWKYGIYKCIDKFFLVMIALSLAAVCGVNFLFIYILSFDTFEFFNEYSIVSFLFGTVWSPNDEVIPSFGILPLVTGTLMIVLISIVFSVGIGIVSSIYIVEYLPKRFVKIVEVFFRILAGLPTVMYGCFAVKILAPAFHDMFYKIGINISYESALVAGISVGIMILPFLISMFYENFKNVPSSLKNASYALGATKLETVLNVILPFSKRGISASILFGFSRAIGETIIVVMAAGISAKMTANPLDTVTTMTVQLVRLLTGDQELGSVSANAAYAVGAFLFIFTWVINAYARKILHKND